MFLIILYNIKNKRNDYYSTIGTKPPFIIKNNKINLINDLAVVFELDLGENFSLLRNNTEIIISSILSFSNILLANSKEIAKEVLSYNNAKRDDKIYVLNNNSKTIDYLYKQSNYIIHCVYDQMEMFNKTLLNKNM